VRNKKVYYTAVVKQLDGMFVPGSMQYKCTPNVGAISGVKELRICKASASCLSFGVEYLLMTIQSGSRAHYQGRTSAAVVNIMI